MSQRTKDQIVLFDVDGTLTPSRRKIEAPMIETLKKLKQKVYIAIVGGSDYNKQIEQLGEHIHMFDYIFAENGLHSYCGEKEIHKQSILGHLGEEKLQEFINFVLGYFSTLKLPKKRGTFIEFRNGMLNISPIGRNCSNAERDEFEKYDHEHNIRKDMVKVLQEKFAHLNLTFSIGGQISFDVFPKGWDKTYCLQFLDEYKTIHFFGDKTDKGGNDYEIYEHDRTVGHKVKTYHDTIKELNEMYNLVPGHANVHHDAHAEGSKPEHAKEAHGHEAKHSAGVPSHIVHTPGHAHHEKKEDHHAKPADTPAQEPVKPAEQEPKA